MVLLPTLRKEAEEDGGKMHLHLDKLPGDFSELLACKGQASPFHVKHFPKGHRATDFERWTKLATSTLAEDCQAWSYEVVYEEFFEPYIVIDRRLILALWGESPHKGHHHPTKPGDRQFQTNVD